MRAAALLCRALLCPALLASAALGDAPRAVAAAAFVPRYAGGVRLVETAAGALQVTALSAGEYAALRAAFEATYPGVPWPADTLDEAKDDDRGGEKRKGVSFFPVAQMVVFELHPGDADLAEVTVSNSAPADPEPAPVYAGGARPYRHSPHPQVEAQRGSKAFTFDSDYSEPEPRSALPAVRLRGGEAVLEGPGGADALEALVLAAHAPSRDEAAARAAWSYVMAGWRGAPLSHAAQPGLDFVSAAAHYGVLAQRDCGVRVWLPALAGGDAQFGLAPGARAASLSALARLYALPPRADEVAGFRACFVDARSFAERDAERRALVPAYVRRRAALRRRRLRRAWHAVLTAMLEGRAYPFVPPLYSAAMGRHFKRAEAIRRRLPSGATLSDQIGAIRRPVQAALAELDADEAAEAPQLRELLRPLRGRDEYHSGVGRAAPLPRLLPGSPEAGVGLALDAALAVRLARAEYDVLLRLLFSAVHMLFARETHDVDDVLRRLGTAVGFVHADLGRAAPRKVPGAPVLPGFENAPAYARPRRAGAVVRGDYRDEGEEARETELMAAVVRVATAHEAEVVRARALFDELARVDARLRAERSGASSDPKVLSGRSGQQSAGPLTRGETTASLNKGAGSGTCDQQSIGQLTRCETTAPLNRGAGSGKSDQQSIGQLTRCEITAPLNKGAVSGREDQQSYVGSKKVDAPHGSMGTGNVTSNQHLAGQKVGPTAQGNTLTLEDNTSHTHATSTSDVVAALERRRDEVRAQLAVYADRVGAGGYPVFRRDAYGLLVGPARVSDAFGAEMRAASIEAVARTVLPWRRRLWRTRQPELLPPAQADVRLPWEATRAVVGSSQSVHVADSVEHYGDENRESNDRAKGESDSNTDPPASPPPTAVFGFPTLFQRVDQMAAVLRETAAACDIAAALHADWDGMRVRLHHCAGELLARAEAHWRDGRLSQMVYHFLRALAGAPGDVDRLLPPLGRVALDADASLGPEDAAAPWRSSARGRALGAQAALFFSQSVSASLLRYGAGTWTQLLRMLAMQRRLPRFALTRVHLARGADASAFLAELAGHPADAADQRGVYVQGPLECLGLLFGAIATHDTAGFGAYVEARECVRTFMDTLAPSVSAPGYVVP